MGDQSERRGRESQSRGQPPTGAAEANACGFQGSDRMMDAFDQVVMADSPPCPYVNQDTQTADVADQLYRTWSQDTQTFPKQQLNIKTQG